MGVCKPGRAGPRGAPALGFPARHRGRGATLAPPRGSGAKGQEGRGRRGQTQAAPRGSGGASSTWAWAGPGAPCKPVARRPPLRSPRPVLACPPAGPAASAPRGRASGAACLSSAAATGCRQLGGSKPHTFILSQPWHRPHGPSPGGAGPGRPSLQGGPFPAVSSLFQLPESPHPWRVALPPGHGQQRGLVHVSVTRLPPPCEDLGGRWGPGNRGSSPLRGLDSVSGIPGHLWAHGLDAGHRRATEVEGQVLAEAPPQSPLSPGPISLPGQGPQNQTSWGTAPGHVPSRTNLALGHRPQLPAPGSGSLADTPGIGGH